MPLKIDAPADPTFRQERDLFWGQMQERLRDVISRLLPKNARIVYLDYPVHRNIGDLMIYLGTTNWLDRAYDQSPTCWNEANFTWPELESEAVILMHGGGNFGDLYPRHQQFREQVIERYASHRIVILPQSVHFSSWQKFETSARKFDAHPDLHLLLRDTSSLEAIRSVYKNVHCLLAPDMASFLYPLDATEDRSYSGKVINLLRRDVEADSGQSRGEWAAAEAVDWADLLRGYCWLMRSVQMGNQLFGRHIPGDPFERLWRRIAWGAVDHAIAALLQADHIVTSRLHGHILACLIGIPNQLLDNSYGKNSAYYREWTTGLTFSELNIASPS